VVVVAIVPPARAVWFDLKSRSEHLLGPGDHDPEQPGDGFIWIDADLPAPEALEALTASGLLPAGIEIDDEALGPVLWALGPDHLHLSLAVARLDGDALLLNRYSIVVTEGGSSRCTAACRPTSMTCAPNSATTSGASPEAMVSPTALGAPCGRSATGLTTCG